MFYNKFRKNPFTVKMSRSCIKQLEVILGRTPSIKSIMKDHLMIERIAYEVLVISYLFQILM